MSSIDQQFVEFVVKSLVNNPDDVQVERTIDEKGVLLELTVNPEDLGRVIGKRGATAQSLRTLLRALGTKNEARYNLKIVDNGVPREEREPAPRKEEKPAKSEDVAEEAPAEEEKPVEEPETVEEEEKEDRDFSKKTLDDLDDLDDLDI